MIAVVARLHRAELTATIREDFVILGARFELGAFLDLDSNTVDELLHFIKVKSEDRDFGMLVRNIQTSGIRPIGPDISGILEDLGHVPAERLDVRQKFLVRFG